MNKMEEELRKKGWVELSLEECVNVKLIPKEMPKRIIGKGESLRTMVSLKEGDPREPYALIYVKNFREYILVGPLEYKIGGSWSDRKLEDGTPAIEASLIVTNDARVVILKGSRTYRFVTGDKQKIYCT